MQLLGEHHAEVFRDQRQGKLHVKCCRQITFDDYSQVANSLKTISLFKKNSMFIFVVFLHRKYTQKYL